MKYPIYVQPSLNSPRTRQITPEFIPLTHLPSSRFTVFCIKITGFEVEYPREGGFRSRMNQQHLEQAEAHPENFTCTFVGLKSHYFNF